MQKNPFSADDPRNAWNDPLLKLAIHAGEARLRIEQLYHSQYDQREPESTFVEAIGNYNRTTDRNKAQFGNLPKWPIANAKIFNIFLKTTGELIEATIRCDEIESEINVPANARLPKFAYFAEIMRVFWNVLKVLPGSKKPDRPDADYITASQALCHIDKLQEWCQIQLKKSEKKSDKKGRGKRDSGESFSPKEKTAVLAMALLHHHGLDEDAAESLVEWARDNPTAESAATQGTNVHPVEGEPDTGGDSGFDLSDTKRLILKAIFELGAVEKQQNVSCPQTATKVKMNPDARLRSELADLRTLKLLGGKKGQRGYWLTPAGIREANRV